MDIIYTIIGLLAIIGPIAGVIIVIILVSNNNKTNNTPKTPTTIKPEEKSPEKIAIESYRQSYKREYLLSINEKNQYWKLRQWADTRRMIIFTKVRLLDLISPRSNQQNYKTLLWKIQAKHVDFVICDTSINIKCVVEIMDSSHNQPDRIERDRFVREVLTACGYCVIQTYNINPETLNKVCGFYKEKEIRHDGETVAADETGRTYRS